MASNLIILQLSDVGPNRDNLFTLACGGILDGRNYAFGVSYGEENILGTVGTLDLIARLQK